MARLVGHFLVLSLVIVALASGLSFLGAAKALERSMIDRMDAIAEIGEDRLLGWVASQREQAIFFASLAEVRDLCMKLLDGSAEERPVAAARLRATLDAMADGHSSLAEVLILAEPGGEVVVSTTRESEGRYFVRDSLFTEGRRGTFVKGVYPSPTRLAPSLTISTPLVDAAGRRLGVFAVHLDLEELDRTLRRRTGLGTTGEAYLVDRYNVFVSAERFGRDQFPRGVHTTGIVAAQEGRDGSGRYRNYAGVDVLGVYRWIDELGVALLVEIAQREAFAPARRVARLTLSIGLLLALTLTVGTVVLARQVARPILGVTDAVRRLAEGDLEAHAPVATRDEIGVLARGFNEMTGRLRVLYGDLRQEIAERRRAQEERESFVAELEATNAELERFTYTVSHDLKSPLVTIRGFLGFLERDVAAGDTKRVRSDVEQITDAVGIMNRLLGEVLELSRVGRVVNPSEDVALSELAYEAAGLFSEEMAGRGVELSIDPDLPVVFGDRTRLLEVFQNLLGNAVRFLGDVAAPFVEVGRRAGADEGEVICYVRDNGVGIEPRYHEKVFGLFERLDAGIEGTGIGLALVKRIVEFHGGRVWVESQGRGEGATFCFSLPRRPSS